MTCRVIGRYLTAFAGHPGADSVPRPVPKRMVALTMWITFRGCKDSLDDFLYVEVMQRFQVFLHVEQTHARHRADGGLRTARKFPSKSN